MLVVTWKESLMELCSKLQEKCTCFVLQFFFLSEYTEKSAEYTQVTAHTCCNHFLVVLS